MKVVTFIFTFALRGSVWKEWG